MIDLGSGYLWVKALHIIAVISWMAGLLYLPRLFVYHCQAEVGSSHSETLKIMERRLYKAIMTPAMVVSLILGLLLMAEIGAMSQGWFHAKALCLVGLIVSHFAMGRWKNAFAKDQNLHSEKYFRFMNEAPTLLMIAIVIFAVVKPF